jgi:hypothetical protein
MARKDLASVMPRASLEQLVHVVDLLRRADDSKVAGQVSDHQNRSAQWADDLGQVEVYGVRDARDSLSKILNQVTEGQLAFIDSGQGGAVVVMSADALTEGVLGLENFKEPTLQSALEQLPFRDELAPLTVRGRPLAKGNLARTVEDPAGSAVGQAGVLALDLATPEATRTLLHLAEEAVGRISAANLASWLDAPVPPSAV